MTGVDAMEDGGLLADTIAALLEEARTGLDPDKRYSEDPRWVDEIELMFGEYMAGGFGDLDGYPELRALLDEVEGWCTDHDAEVTLPEELVRAYVALTFSSRLSG